jgi:hypothetical protein
MTENYPQATAQWTDPLPSAQEPQGTTEVVKEQAADLGGSTVQAGKHTAQVAREQASDVAAEATRQGRDLLQQAQSQVGEQVAQGQQRLASELLSISEELRSMADSSERDGTASELARQAASRTRDIGRWLDARGPAEVVDEVQSFARRRPGMFLAIAVGAGLVAGRLTRGIKDASSDEGAPSQPYEAAPSQPYAGTGYPPYEAAPSQPYAGTGYPPVGGPEAAPDLSVPAAGRTASMEGLPPAAGDTYVEETYVEETYVPPEPFIPGDQSGAGEGR